MPKRTLRRRLVRLTVLFCIFFIALFVMAQIKSQVDSNSRYALLKASQGAYITKNALDASFTLMETGSEGIVGNIFRAALTPLVDSGIVEKAIIFSSDSKVIDALGAGGEDKNALLAKPGHFRSVMDFFETDKSRSFMILKDPVNREVDVFIRLEVSGDYFVELKYSEESLLDTFRQIQIPLLFTLILVVIGAGFFGLLLSRAVIVPIKMLNAATKEVAGGKLDWQVLIETNDELEELGNAFNKMTVEIQKLQMRAENANPLTKLPGNIMIMQEVERRIGNRQKFVVIYSDLNNFKAFNDKYGIHQGDEVIKMTAETIKESVQKKGSPDDLVGHEGGDDFLIVTTPEKAPGVAEEIIRIFNERSKGFFSPYDVNQGFFTATGRDGKVSRFPLLGIALAGVTNQHRPLRNYAEVSHICSEVKKKAKSFPSSAWVLDQRIGEIGPDTSGR